MSDDNVVNCDEFEQKRLCHLVHELFKSEKQEVTNKIKILEDHFKNTIESKMLEYVSALMRKGEISELTGNDYLRFCKENPLKKA